MKLRNALLILLAASTLTACGGVDPNSPLGQRQAIFKQMLKTSEDLGGMIRGRIVFDEARFVEGAAKLDQISRTPWQHFPQIKEEDHTNAKDDVWKRQARFKELADDLENSTAALVVATTAKPLKSSDLAAPVKRVEDSCKACHQEFRNH
ncbi:Cytochrome c556 [Pseudomonas marincola]|jgi:cytochrome c556|uniref:Cytochrome C n=1 Tax=Pseudomonas marincola TaxID=437900 RepID=A0A1I7D5Z3_9PSED|nr:MULTISPECIES: cytochrome c [Pseudomonas]MAB99295.1 cytochrome C [Pseudomonadaceae bacterium]NRH26148.1 cytochrome c [Pseudomonas sp. MS19]CAE6888205.1 Cytochrome c556 [Pseudomonas marincola]SFU07143.1 Cytochrome c556 [Pseudomonas marincola]